MPHAISLFAVLYGVWLALSGHYTPFLLIVGAVAAALTVAIALRMDVVDHEGQPIHLTWRLPAYWLWLGWQIIVWALHVSGHVLRPRLAIDPVLERVPASQRSDLGKVIYANSITLTPGTLSAEVSGAAIQVHALTGAAMVDLKSGEMARRVSALEGKP